MGTWHSAYCANPECLDLCPAVAPPLQLPAHAHPGRQWVIAPGTWAPAIHVGDLDGVLGSYLSPSPAPAVAGIRGVNQQVDHLLSLYVS